MGAALAVPVAVLHVYYLRLQTYVTRLDAALNGISLAFVAWEVAFGLLAAAAFWRAQRY